MTTDVDVYLQMPSRILGSDDWDNSLLTVSCDICLDDDSLADLEPEEYAARTDAIDGWLRRVGQLEFSILDLARAWNTGANVFDLMDSKSADLGAMANALFRAAALRPALLKKLQWFDGSGPTKLMLINRLFVEPSARGSRVGSKALDLLLTHHDQGCEAALLEICPFEPGVRFLPSALAQRKKQLARMYQALGFTPLRGAYYGKNIGAFADL